MSVNFPVLLELTWCVMRGRGPTGFFPYKWSALSEHLLNQPSLPSALWWIHLLCLVFQISARTSCSVFSSPFLHYFEGLKFFCIIFFLCFELELAHVLLFKWWFYKRCCSFSSGHVMSNSLQPHGPQQIRPPCPSLSPRVCPSSCPLNRWRHPAISSSVVPFSSRLQSLPASGSFPKSWLFASGDRSIEASASVIPKCIQGWFPLRLTGFISWLSKALSKLFSSTTVWKHQFSGALPSLYL